MPDATEERQTNIFTYPYPSWRRDYSSSEPLPLWRFSFLPVLPTRYHRQCLMWVVAFSETSNGAVLTVCTTHVYGQTSLISSVITWALLRAGRLAWLPSLVAPGYWGQKWDSGQQTKAQGNSATAYLSSFPWVPLTHSSSSDKPVWFPSSSTFITTQILWPPNQLLS